jgi:hypothetical protein
MKLQDFFKPKRFWLLLKKDFYTQYKTYLIAIGAICCILFIVNVSSVASWNKWNFNQVFYPLTLFIGGFIFTSLCFSELGGEQSKIGYFTLPASIFEKLASRLVVSNIGYVIISVGFYFLFTVIAFIVNFLLFGVAHPVFNPFDPVIVFCVQLYLVTQSVFFLGAIYFRNNTFIKTIVAVFVIALALAVFAGLMFFGSFYLVMAIRHIDFPFDLFFKGQFYPAMPPVFAEIGKIALVAVHVSFWFVLAPLVWVTSYFRLRDTEV